MSWGDDDLRAHDDHAVHAARPQDIRSLGRTLGDVADNLDLVARLLGQVSTYGVWESPSGDTFAAEVGEVPITLRRVAARMGDVGDLVTRYAGTLESAQESLQRTEERYRRETSTIDEIDRQLALYSPHPHEDALLARRGEAVADAITHEQTYVRTADEAYDDESLLAADVDAVCVDLEDPRGYDVLEGARDLGRTSAFTGPWAGLLKPLRLGTALDPAGQTGLKLAYGQGSWRRIALDSSGLVADAVVKGTGSRVRRLLGDAPAPAVAGARPSATRAAGTARTWSAAAPDPVPVTSRWQQARRASSTWTRRGVGVGRDKATAAVRKETGMDLADELLGDWEAVAGASRRVKGLQAVNSTTKVVRFTRKTVDTSRSRAEQLDRLDRRDQPDQRSQPEQRSEDTAPEPSGARRSP